MKNATIERTRYLNRNAHTRGRIPWAPKPGAKINWNNTNVQIAKDNNVSPMTILLYRRRMGIEPLQRGRPVVNDQKPHEVLQIGNVEQTVQNNTMALLKPIVSKHLQTAVNKLYAEMKEKLDSMKIDMENELGLK